MDYFENFEGPPAPPALPTGWSSTSEPITVAQPWDRISVNGSLAAHAVPAEDVELGLGSSSTINSPSIPIGKLGGVLTFKNLYNLESAEPLVTALLVQEDNGIIIGGDFTSVLGVPRFELARILPDGSLDPNFNLTCDARVDVIIQDPITTQIYVGGFFSTIEGISRNKIARINYPNDGVNVATVDLTFDAKVEGARRLREITILTPGSGIDGRIFIGGSFAIVGGLSAFKIAKLKYDGSLDTDFTSPLQIDSAFTVARIIVDPGTEASGGDIAKGIIIGGLFTTVDGQNNLAKLDVDTGFSNLTFTAFTDGMVFDIALDTINNFVYPAGSFQGVNSEARSRIAKVDRRTGVLDATFVPNPAIGATVDPAIGKVYLNPNANPVDAILLIGGHFTVSTIPVSNNFARMNTIDGQVISLDITLDEESVTIFEIQPYPFGDTSNFLIGGVIFAVNGQPINSLAKVNIDDGSLDSNFNKMIENNTGLDGMVLNIQIGGDTNPFVDIITAGGSFTQGGYNKFIPLSSSNPLAGRQCWSGLSGGTAESPEYITTQIELPMLAQDENIVLQWVLGNDGTTVLPTHLVALDDILIKMHRNICILKGAYVFTNKGKVKIENLRKGHYVLDEKRNFHVVTRILKSPMGKYSKKTVCIRKSAISPEVPSDELRITHGHHIKVRPGQDERLVETLVTEESIMDKSIRSLKQQDKFMYSICTKERVFVNVNNLWVATWCEEEAKKMDPYVVTI